MDLDKCSDAQSYLTFVMKNVNLTRQVVAVSVSQPFLGPQFLPFPLSSQQSPVWGTLTKQNWEESNTKKLTDQADESCQNLCF